MDRRMVGESFDRGPEQERENVRVERLDRALALAGSHDPPDDDVGLEPLLADDGFCLFRNGVADARLSD